MIRLWHRCGSSVDYAHGWDGRAYVALFSDPQTDDPLTHCPGCTRELYPALREGEFRCTAPGEAKPLVDLRAAARVLQTALAALL